MDAERLDPLSRIYSTSAAIDGLHALLAAEEPLDDVLRRVADTAVQMTPDAEAVTITVLDGSASPARTAACTDPSMLELDLKQYSSGRGPCLHAAHQRQSVRFVVDPEDQRWPEFAAAAAAIGVRTSLSVPLQLVADADREQGPVGSMNVYSRSGSAFDPFDEGLVTLYTVAAGAAITNGRRWQESRRTVDQLERALTSRSDIDQAKGALRAIHGYTAVDAFAALVDESQRRNVKVYTVASEFLATLAHEPPARLAIADGESR